MHIIVKCPFHSLGLDIAHFIYKSILINSLNLQVHIIPLATALRQNLMTLIEELYSTFNYGIIIFLNTQMLTETLKIHAGISCSEVYTY